MFKRIISRNSGTPWPATRLTSELWLKIPTRLVRISELIATQDGVYLHALSDKHVTLYGDLIPHVICYGGELYIEDGHHRIVFAATKGQTEVLVRVLWC